MIILSCILKWIPFYPCPHDNCWCNAMGTYLHSPVVHRVIDAKKIRHYECNNVGTHLGRGLKVSSHQSRLRSPLLRTSNGMCRCCWDGRHVWGRPVAGIVCHMDHEVSFEWWFVKAWEGHSCVVRLHMGCSKVALFRGWIQVWTSVKPMKLIWQAVTKLQEDVSRSYLEWVWQCQNIEFIVRIRKVLVDWKLFSVLSHSWSLDIHVSDVQNNMLYSTFRLYITWDINTTQNNKGVQVWFQNRRAKDKRTRKDDELQTPTSPTDDIGDKSLGSIDYVTPNQSYQMDDGDRSSNASFQGQVQTQGV